MNNWKPIDRIREYGKQTEKVETSEFSIYNGLERTVFKLCCYYHAKTELYDRTLTYKRSRSTQQKHIWIIVLQEVCQINTHLS